MSQFELIGILIGFGLLIIITLFGKGPEESEEVNEI